MKNQASEGLTTDNTPKRTDRSDGSYERQRVAEGSGWPGELVAASVGKWMFYHSLALVATIGED